MEWAELRECGEWRAEQGIASSLCCSVSSSPVCCCFFLLLLFFLLLPLLICFSWGHLWNVLLFCFANFFWRVLICSLFSSYAAAAAVVVLYSFLFFVQFSLHLRLLLLRGYKGNGGLARLEYHGGGRRLLSPSLYMDMRQLVTEMLLLLLLRLVLLLPSSNSQAACGGAWCGIGGCVSTETVDGTRGAGGGGGGGRGKTK